MRRKTRITISMLGLTAGVADIKQGTTEIRTIGSNGANGYLVETSTGYFLIDTGCLTRPLHW